MNLLFIGDVFGRPGRKVLNEILPSIKAELKIDICLANCENAAAGSGITEKIFNQLKQAGVDAFTSGNHLWDNKASLEFLQHEKRITKPLNYPPKALGAPYCILEYQGYKVIVLTLIGQAFMPPANSPFERFDEIYEEIKQLGTCIIVDFHAEATAEKKALACYLNGRVSCVLGTHTHVQTADEQILNKGTGFITDVGMTGPHDSIIGIKKEIILEKLLTGMPKRYDVAESGLELNAVLVEIDMDTGKTTMIKRIKRSV
jgi:2',3'-cyclic-nucleotide 2'-phosphodiesterase